MISGDFCPILEQWGIPADRISVVENWAPLAELSPVPRHNGWSSEHELDDSIVILYSGTLGLKHNPELLAQLAARFSDRPECRVVVISEGLGADHLATAKKERGLDNLVLLPFQPYERFAEVLGSADVLVAILEPEAGVFSVPSKVLSYHCAGRPILGSIPNENLAARITTREHSGVVTDPRAVDEFADSAEALVREPDLRSAMGHNARRYAERTFDIVAISDTFETILTRASNTVRGHEFS